MSKYGEVTGEASEKMLIFNLIFIVGNIPAEGFLTCNFYSLVPKIY